MERGSRYIIKLENRIRLMCLVCVTWHFCVYSYIYTPPHSLTLRTSIHIYIIHRKGHLLNCGQQSIVWLWMSLFLLVASPYHQVLYNRMKWYFINNNNQKTPRLCSAEHRNLIAHTLESVISYLCRKSTREKHMTSHDMTKSRMGSIEEEKPETGSD